MARMRSTPSGMIALTTAQNDQRDAEEATWEAARPAQAMTDLRIERNSLLAESDWTQSPDSPLASEAKTEWATYRQNLRDIPENVEDPANPSWPDAPS